MSLLGFFLVLGNFQIVISWLNKLNLTASKVLLLNHNKKNYLSTRKIVVDCLGHLYQWIMKILIDDIFFKLAPMFFCISSVLLKQNFDLKLEFFCLKFYSHVQLKL